MVKKIIKEIAITILLLIAVIVILGVVLYDYIPTRKTIPNKVAYQIPEEISNELKAAEVQETSPINIVYEMDKTEIKGYEKSGGINTGKVNPFTAISGSTENTSNTTNNTNTTNNINNSGTSSGNSNSTGTFLNNAGSK